MAGPDDREGEMGMVLRFPIERARIAPGEFFADDEQAKILILPTVRIERERDELELAAIALGDQSPAPNSMGGRRRRRTPRS